MHAQQYLHTVMPLFILVTFSMIYMGFPDQTFVSCGFVALVAGLLPVNTMNITHLGGWGIS